MSMAALLDLHPDTTHPVSSGVAEMTAVLDRMHAAPTWPGRGEHAAVVAEVDRAIRRLEALKLKLVAAADKAGTAKDAGFTDTDAWVAKTTTVSRSDAAREVALATELDVGPRRHRRSARRRPGLARARGGDRATPPGNCLTGSALSSARSSKRTWWRRPAGSAPTSSAGSPAGRSRPSNPTRRVVDAHENELVRSEEQAAQDKCSLTLHDNGDGTTTGHFTVPALAAAILGKVIDAMTAPRRMREPGTSRTRTGRSTGGTAAGSRSPSSSSTSPPTTCTPRRAATVVVTIDHTVLAGALKAAHLDTDQTLSAGEARRLACNAGILPAVLGTKSVALDLGHDSPAVLRVPTSRRKDSNTPPAPPPAANAPTPGASSTTDNPGPTAASTDLANADPALPPTPPMDPRHRLQPPVHARRQRQIQPAHVRTGVASGYVQR